MPPTGASDNSLNARPHRRIRRSIRVCAMAAMLLLAATMAGAAPLSPDATLAASQPEFLDTLLHTCHDELIMLVTALVVIIEIATGFDSIRPLPDKSLLLGSFAAMVFSALFTVLETMVFATWLNVLEHLSFTIASCLLALWCGRVFVFNKREGR